MAIKNEKTSFFVFKFLKKILHCVSVSKMQTKLRRSF